MTGKGRAVAISLGQNQRQSQVLAPQLRQGVKILAMTLGELRAELVEEMSRNPVIDDVEQTLERTKASELERKAEESVPEHDYPAEDFAAEDAFVSGLNRGEPDPEAAERRELLFARQTRGESLAEHLLAQLPYVDVTEAERALIEQLIGHLDGDGYFRDSVKDVAMVAGTDEAHVLAALAHLRAFDPPGCGAQTHAECLLSQLDQIPDAALRETVRGLLERHWQDMAEGRYAAIAVDLGIGLREYARAMRALRTLDPKPGLRFSANQGDEYVHPEVHAVKVKGRWMARVDARSLPEIRFSKTYLRMLDDPQVDEATREYLRARVEAARQLIEAVANRQDTITAIAQAIFDAQGDFFVRGRRGIRPLKMQDVAEKCGVDVSTVSRTVRGKYATTPFGTMELRNFFVQAVETASGEVVSRQTVLDRLRALVEGEDPSQPLGDGRLSEMLKAEGFQVERRTVAKYRTMLGIPAVGERRRTDAGAAVGKGPQDRVRGDWQA